MTPENWIVVGLFGLGVAANAGIVWRGLSSLQEQFKQLRAEVEDIKKGEYGE